MDAKPLQFLALRGLIEHLPTYMPQILELHRAGRYIGDHNTAKDLLNVMSYYGKEKQKEVHLPNPPFMPRFDQDHIDLIMDIFTFMIIDYSPELIFPPSRYIPSCKQLHTHLIHHGDRLTKFSLDVDYIATITPDKLLEIICDSLKFLKILTIPDCSYSACSRRSVKIIEKSQLPNTLHELNLMATRFTTLAVLLDIISSLTHLKKLNLSKIRIFGYRGPCAQSLPLPIFDSLFYLEHLWIYDFYSRYYDHRPLSNTEWSEFIQYHPNLKTIQLSGKSSWRNDYVWSLEEGLKMRKTPLMYLGVKEDYEQYRCLIRRMNADKITTGETIQELLYDISMGGGLNYVSVHDIVSNMTRIWQICDKSIDKCRDMLSVINLLIPRYKHISRVFYTCSEVILYMAKSLRLREEFQLTPSYVETFITHLLMDPENENEDLVNIFEILALYENSISVVVFETVWKTLALQDYSQYFHTSERLS